MSLLRRTLVEQQSNSKAKIQNCTSFFTFIFKFLLAQKVPTVQVSDTTKLIRITKTRL
jgi:hypothetical protein